MMLDTNAADLFSDFDAGEIAAIAAAEARAKQQAGVARAQRSQSRHQLRRANSEKLLGEILPARIEPGDTWDVISRGDIDALSYLRHALSGYEFFDQVVLSTWCIAKPDLDELRSWLDSGRIDSLHIAAGEIFPSQYGDEYEAALLLVRDYDARLTIARNHSKVILANRADADCWLAMRGSANVNTNPRIEQTVITNDKALHDFYVEFFDGIRSIDRDRPNTARQAG